MKDLPPKPKKNQERSREFVELVAAVRRVVGDRPADGAEPEEHDCSPLGLGAAPGGGPLADAVIRFDRDLRCIEVLPVLYGPDGQPTNACAGKTNRELGLPEELCTPWDAALRRVFETGEPERLVLSLPGADSRHLDCRLTPEVDTAGVVRSVLSVSRDVTELRHAYDKEHRARYLHDAFREASLLLAGSLNRDVVFATLLECMRQVVPFDRAAVMLVEEGSRATVRTVFDGETIHSAEIGQRPVVDPNEHPKLQEILAEGASLAVGDTAEQPCWTIDPEAKNASWLGVALRARGYVVGLFVLEKKEPGYFTPERRQVAELMSSQAAVAVENSILFEQMETSNKRMRSLSRRLVQVQENERRHIARELHDDAGQALVSLRYGLRLLEKEIGPDGTAAAHVAELRRRTDAVMDSLHRLAVDLRPASLDHLGLDAALRQYSLAAGTKFGLAVRFKSRGFDVERLPSAVETALYRVVQEAMTNVVRHARATRVDLLLERRGEQVIVMIEDDGVGFDQSRLERPDHLGLIGLRERAEALGGTLTVESSPGSGTTIVVEVSSADPNPDR